jgi:hypothetical protein
MHTAIMLAVCIPMQARWMPFPLETTGELSPVIFPTEAWHWAPSAPVHSVRTS